MDSNITINIVEPGSVVPVPDTGLSTTGIDGATASILVTIAAVVIIAIATILHLRKKKISLKPSKRTSTILGLLAIITSIGTFTGLTLNSIYNNTNAEEGTLTVNAEDADLTIELGDEPVFAVLPVDVKVAESTPAGYTLTSYTETTGLVSTTDDTNIIPMISTDEGELAALKDNTYGLSTAKPESKDDKTYTLLSTAADNPTFITDKDYKATEANDTTTVYYGFYITPDTPYGTYKSSDIYYNATTNSSEVIFHSNGLYFNDDPEQTTNDVEYLTSITDETAKYSHTPNINDEGIADGALSYNTQTNNVVAIPGAATLHIVYTYGGGRQYGSAWGYGSFWEGSHPDYTPDNNYSSGIQNCGGGTITDGKYYSDNNTQFTVECDISGDTATFGYWTSGGGPGSTATSYGYYAVVTGYDADGNIIYLNNNTPKKGEYKEPAQDLPYIFKGWSEYKDATSPTYTSAEDIEKNAPLTMGETTELYAIWQHATKIHFDGNGADGGVGLPDRLIAAGQSTYLGNYNSDMNYQTAYTKTGYYFSGWNTKADGSGTAYSEYTAPTNKSENLTLYAQWAATTITFSGNGATSGSMDQFNIPAGTTANLPQNTFTRTGYAFNGWNTSPDGTGTSYSDQASYYATAGVNTSVTLHAQWSPATTIIYDGNGGEGNQQQQTIRAGETGSIYRGQSYFSRDGYLFSHWNTESDGTGVSYYEGDQFTASDQSQVITFYAQWTDNAMLDTGTTVNVKLKRLAGNSHVKYDTSDTNVTAIARASDLPADFTPTDDNTISIDGSVTPVYAWYDTDTTTIYYYAESDKIIMNPNSSYMFYNFMKLSDTTSIADWDAFKVTNMQSMFSQAGYNATTWSLDLSSWDTSKVTNMQSMFSQAGRNATTFSLNLSSWDISNVTDMSKMLSLAGSNATTWSLDLSSWDTSNMTDMSEMFSYVGYNATTWSLDLSSWDTLNVTDMSSMFNSAGYNATTWSLDLSSWDTSRVTNMQSMFSQAGSNATTWSIDGLSSWDTSKVTNMQSMFYWAGYNATTWSLDLSSWDTSRVTNMQSMFSQAGSNATTWSLDLSSWDTLNVTDMSSMFNSAGYNATTWSLDLSSWDTSKVTNMYCMFEDAGYNATTWSLDLSSWDTLNVTDMSGMFEGAGYNATTFSLDFSSWDTSNVTDMRSMFHYAGYNATTWSLDLSSWDTLNVTDMSQMFLDAGSNATTWSLDLSSWDTSNVTNMTFMFYAAGPNATTWSVAIPPKTGDIDNTTSAFYGKDSSVRATPPSGKFFTLAVQTNPNTANTTGNLNSVNNAEVPNQDGSSGNRSVYATEDVGEIENTENDDSTSSNTTSTPSRQEPLGEHQGSATVDDEGTNIIIPTLIAASIALGTSALVLLAYKSHRREDE